VQNNKSALWLKTPVFLPKRPKKGPFFLSVIFLQAMRDGLDVDDERLTTFCENMLFEAGPF
jgi:hypothetical protein